MWFSGRLISQLDHLNRAKDSWRREREITDTKRDEEVNWGGGTERHDGRQRGRNRHRKGKGRRIFRKSSPARDNMAQPECSLIGHRYLEKCKVGLDSAGYLQTEWYYTLLIGSARVVLINQSENRHQEQRKRRGEEGVESDGWR